MTNSQNPIKSLFKKQAKITETLAVTGVTILIVKQSYKPWSSLNRRHFLTQRHFYIPPSSRKENGIIPDCFTANAFDLPMTALTQEIETDTIGFRLDKFAGAIA